MFELVHTKLRREKGILGHMKTLTCAQFGGSCDFAAAAATEKEMSDIMWKHVKESHREKFKETQKMMEKATPEEKGQSTAYFHKIWEAAPEDSK